jgi:hypothetical protein
VSMRPKICIEAACLCYRLWQLPLLLLVHRASFRYL